MARGTIALILGLFVLSLVVILVVAVVVVLIGDAQIDFAEALTLACPEPGASEPLVKSPAERVAVGV